MSDQPNPEQKLFDLVDEFRTGMLTTRHGDILRSRPMGLMLADDDGVLWFFTSRDSQKVDEVDEDHDVNVAFADQGKSTYISISGKAQVVRDVEKQKELWNPFVKIWFEGPEDPNLVMLKVTPGQAEYWDSPSNKMVQFAGMIKALLTGKGKELGENEKVSL